MVMSFDDLFTVPLQVQTDTDHIKPIQTEILFTKCALLESTLL